MALLLLRRFFASSMSKNTKKFPKLSSPLLRARLSLKEQVLFAKRLSLLVKAGVPILKSLSLLETQAVSRANRKMFAQILRDVANGQFLFKSLSRFQGVFGDFAINVIRIGETSGSLSENLKYLAEEIEKKRMLRQKIVGALVYPVVIMIAAFSVSGLMTVYLFPKLLPVFKSLNVQLPLITRALIGISAFLLQWWLALVAVLIVCVIAFAFLMRLEAFRFRVNQMSLKIPFVGTLLMHYHLVNICRTLGNLMRSNIRILEAITITADTSTNLVYRKTLRHLHQSIAKGGNISTYLEKHPRFFPPMLSQMVAIGETTGNLSETLLYLGEMYEQELDEQTKRLSSTIEPLMMVMMGVLVGFIAISIITPIYEITQHLNPR